MAAMQEGYMTDKQMQELLRRLGRENQAEAQKAWLTLKMQQRRN